MTELTLEFPLPHADCAQNSRGHWRKGAKAARQARTSACTLARMAMKGTKLLWSRAVVHMVYDTSPPLSVRGYRPKDVQNAIGAVKSIVDGCVDAGVIVDDKAENLSWGPSFIVKNGTPGVTLTFRRLS